MKTCEHSYEELAFAEDGVTCEKCGGTVCCAVCQEPGGGAEDMLVDGVRGDGPSMVFGMVHGWCLDGNDAWRMA